MIDKIFAIVVLTLCVVFMVRLLLGERWRHRFDAWGRHLWWRLRNIHRWRSSRKSAARLAEEAIRRARENGSWQGNVYKPKSFKRPRKPH